MESISCKQCFHCKQNFPASEDYFHKSKNKTGLHSYCKTCSAKLRRVRRREVNKEQWWHNQQKRRRWKHENSKKGDPRYSFNLTYMPYTPKFCPIFDQELIYSAAPGSCYGASIDRIDSSKPYVDDNVMVLSIRANNLKNDATFEELVLLGSWAQKMIDLGYGERKT